MQRGLVAEIGEAEFWVAVQFVQTKQHTVLLSWVAMAKVGQDSLPGIGRDSGGGGGRERRFVGDFSQGTYCGRNAWGRLMISRRAAEPQMRVAAVTCTVNRPGVGSRQSSVSDRVAWWGIADRLPVSTAACPRQSLPHGCGYLWRIRNYVTTTLPDRSRCGDGHGLGPPCSPPVMKWRWRVQLGPTRCR
jgi:hypothetical protein